MSKAFVIQIHSGWGATHYDLMLEVDESLATWQLPRSPLEPGPPAPIAARKLPDHRRAYLTYEGPVSKGRGRVDIMDRGECDLLLRRADRWEFRLLGRVITGRFELARSADDPEQWKLIRLGD